ncbi:RES family NAD+ phosphorylase [Chitinolyticbacter meiyuanensis]|uniref:RES family NAD+ phosphorylase n=1 Tax=Chitinolyticbacter meiyuanensis TaxID=682798 RepID=UPI001651B802|nr:RES family NAD+ phosphorylase [Chitinolyticbacter meiyuanensis]
MRAWRIARAAYATDLSGYGAALEGGRWNHRDVPAVYAATSRALCALEVLAHLPEPGLMPRDYQLVVIDLPDDAALYTTVTPPPDWDAVPPSDASREVGTRWLREAGQVGLYVPSVIVPLEANLMLNPTQLAAHGVNARIEAPFDFDARLLK